MFDCLQFDMHNMLVKGAQAMLTGRLWDLHDGATWMEYVKKCFAPHEETTQFAYNYNNK